MNTRPKILVGYDGSTDAEHAVAWAADYAKASDGSVRLLTAWNWPYYDGGPLVYENYDPAEIAKNKLAEVARRTTLPEDRVTIDALKGQPVDVLTREADQADLLVLGSRGVGAYTRAMVGSVSEGCARHATSAVAVVRPSTAKTGVLVGVDDSESARVALRFAMNYAERMNEPLTVVHCVHPEPISPRFGYPITYDRHAATTQAGEHLHELVDKEIAERGRPLPAGYNTLVIEGRAAGSLVDQSHKFAVTVVGRRGIGGFRRLVLGSTSSALTHHAAGTLIITPSVS